LLQQRIDVSRRPGEKLELSWHLGAVCDEALGKSEDAIRVYRRVLSDIDPTDKRALAALESIYTREGRSSELKALFEHELENAVGDVKEEAEVRAKLARLAEQGERASEAIEG
jgi:hypothetical protein